VYYKCSIQTHSRNHCCCGETIISTFFFYVLLTVHLSAFISLFNQLDAKNLFRNMFYFMPLQVSSTCAHHQEVKIVLHSCPCISVYLSHYLTNLMHKICFTISFILCLYNFRAHSLWYHHTYRCDDTRGCVMQF